MNEIFCLDCKKQFICAYYKAVCNINFEEIEKEKNTAEKMHFVFLQIIANNCKYMDEFDDERN